MNTPHDARAVANFILSDAWGRGKQLTVMQLLKLVYLAHGWTLALLDRPLIKDDVQAWQYGPVIPTVYRAFSGAGSAPLTKLAVEKATGLDYEERFDDAERQIMSAVVKSYGDKHAFELSDIMHKPGTPWTQTFESKGAYSTIPTALISEHFKGLRKQRSGATV